MSTPEDRLSAIEQRLARIEDALRLAPARPAAEAPLAVASGRERPDAARTARQSRALDLRATQLMAWAASFAFILAATYFVKLVYDSGWLTPDRQVGLAFIGGLALVGAGLLLAEIDRSYAAYLPAVGVVILYLALYAGQLFYGLFEVAFAHGAIAVVTFTAVWLGWRFENAVYALLAVVGSYLAPLLVHSERGELLDLVAYFTAWSVLFSILALVERRRLTYLLALYFALIGFDVAFRELDPRQLQWATAVTYQLVQFGVFSSTAVAYSIRHRDPMSGPVAAAHGGALFYFYALEYALLRENLALWAPWLALASVLAVLGLYLAARIALRERTALPAGALLVSTYASVVTAHVLFFELVPDGAAPWLALAIPFGAAAVWRAAQGPSRTALIPVVGVSALMFCYELGRLFESPARYAEIPLASTLLCLYAAALDLGYLYFRRTRGLHSAAPLLLYAGHVTLLTATARIFDSGLVVSMVWAVFALALLGYAVLREDRVVGQSALAVFVASGLKVLLYDLSGRATLLRVLALVVLALCLYTGGWLYQRVTPPDERFHPDPEVNQQLNLVRRLVARGLANEGVASELIRRRVPYLGSEGGWNPEVVRQLRADYPLG